MVIISTVHSLTDVAIKAVSLLSHLPEKWYRDGQEIEKFKSTLAILSQSARQWEIQAQQNGTSEDAAYNAFLAEAVDLLDAEKDYYEKHRRSWSSKWKRRSFPSQLPYILSSVLELVLAGPEHRARSLQRQELLIKKVLTDSSVLPFWHDPKYVPPSKTVDEVQRALEDMQGQQVVTLYGAPGMGKSSLAKFVALHHQDLARRSTSWFDGVQYLFCGQRCRNSIYRLRKEFFSSLGFGALFSNLGFDAVIEQGLGQDYNLSRYQSVLRGLLAGRKLLVILDDVWEEDSEVLTNFISQGTPCKFLLTSHSKNVWLDAKSIEMPRPTEGEALAIFTNHVQGFWNRGPFGTPFCSVRTKLEIQDMLQKLDNHPLSIVNIAVSLNRDRLDSNQWESLAQNYFPFLDQSHHKGHIVVYERPYSLTLSVAATMMLMVDSLRGVERDLLFLIARLEETWGSGVPENLIRFFIRRLYRDNSSKATFKYFSALRYLEDNSLVQVGKFEHLRTSHSIHSTFSEDSVGTNQMSFSVHSLRREYIRRKRLPELQNVASILLATHGTHHHESSQVMNVLDTDHSLALVLDVVHFDEAMRDEVALSFQGIATQMAGAPRSLEQISSGTGSGATRADLGLVPRGLQQVVDARELVKSAKSRCNDEILEVMGTLIELLSLEAEERWKQVHSDAKKIIMKLVCQEKLDDASMASLLKTPYTRDAGYLMFGKIYVVIYETTLDLDFYFGQRNLLSDTLPETWRALSNLAHKKIMPASRDGTGSMAHIIQAMLEFESESTALGELQKLRELSDMSPGSLFQRSVQESFLALHENRFSFETLRSMDLHDYLPTILWKLMFPVNEEDYVFSAASTTGYYAHVPYFTAMNCIKNHKGYVEMLLTFPAPCDEWLTNGTLFRQLLRLEIDSNLGPERSFLGVLSGTPEFRAKASRILRGDRWQELDFTTWPESFQYKLARFWGNVALVEDLPGTTRSRLMKIAKDWVEKLRKRSYGEILCFSCRCSCSGETCNCEVYEESIFLDSVSEVTRTIMIIMHLDGSSSSSSECSLQTFAFQGSQDRWRDSTCEMCMARGWYFYVGTCQGQARAYHQMKMYAEALLFLELGQQACLAVPTESGRRAISQLFFEEDGLRLMERELSSHIMLLKALSKDYQGAMDTLLQYEQSLSPKIARRVIVQALLCANRAVLLRLIGESSKAIRSFDDSLEYLEKVILVGGDKAYRRYGQRLCNFLTCRLLDHCAYAKYLVQDIEGAKLDLGDAEIIRSSEMTLEPVSWELLSHQYYRLDEELDLEYSLLQLPIP